MFTQFLFSAALFAAAIIPSLADSGVQPFENPSFETCTETPISGVTRPTDWIQGGSGSNANPTVRCSSDYAHTGSNSGMFTPKIITDISGPTYYAEIYQDIDLVQSGQLLTLTWWVFRGSVPVEDPDPNGQYTFTVWYNDDHLHEVAVNATVVPGSRTPASHNFWQYTASFHAPNNAGQTATLTIGFEATAAIYIYVDDIEIVGPIITGDPQFIGLRGQSYQVHGIDGEVYNIVSSPSTQVNAKFAFLSEGNCPVFEGIPATNCWSHPGSYLGAIGVQQIVGSTVHKLAIVSGSATQGFASIVLNGKALSVGDSFEDSMDFSVQFTSTHAVSVKTREYSFTFENSDLFINQGVTVRKALSQLQSHGLLGQTHQRKIYQSAIKYIDGSVDDYMIEDRQLFGTSFMHNKFQQE